MTGHTWQSMKHRYKAQLAKKQTAAVEAEKPEGSKTAEEKTEVINYLDVVVTILLFLVVFFGHMLVCFHYCFVFLVRIFKVKFDFKYTEYFHDIIKLKQHLVKVTETE